MATIPASTKGLRHVRKTVAFDGGAGSGAVGTIPVFTCTGWVYVQRITGRCTEDIAAGGVTALGLGISAEADLFGGAAYETSEDATDVENGDDFFSGLAGGGYASNDRAVGSDIILTTDTQITNGTLVFDAWYLPITDDGALVGDDADVSDLDAILYGTLTEGYAGDGEALTLAKALHMLVQKQVEAAIVANTLTVKQRDQSTPAFTLTLDSATAPSSVTQAT